MSSREELKYALVRARDDLDVDLRAIERVDEIDLNDPLASHAWLEDVLAILVQAWGTRECISKEQMRLGKESHSLRTGNQKNISKQLDLLRDEHEENKALSAMLHLRIRKCASFLNAFYNENPYNQPSNGAI